MGVPKRQNKRKNENQKPAKKKEARKNNKKNNDNDIKQNEHSNENLDENNKNTDEFKELKDIMKNRNMTHLPLIVAATILENLEDIEKLIQSGHNLNEAGLDKMSPILHASKNKSIAILEFLIQNGADMSSVDEQGDNLFLVALNSKIWDEENFIKFYNKMKLRQDLDLEYKNNFGNSVIHYTVKRHWGTLLHQLIADGVKIDVGNKKGITPLMMCTARNHPIIVQILIKSGAKPLLEDERGCTALCYAMANIVQKKMKAPYSTLANLTARFGNKKNGPSWRNYMKRRLEMLISPPEDQLHIFQEVSSKIVLPVIGFFIRNVQTGLEILLELNVFTKIKEAIERHIDMSEYVSSLLSLYSELLRYCNCCTGCGMPAVKEEQVVNSFISSGGAEICLFTLLKYSDTISSKTMTPAALMPLFLVCSHDGRPLEWLRDNYVHLAPFYQQFFDICIVNFNMVSDEFHIQLTKQKIRRFKNKFEELQKEFEMYKKCDNEPDKEIFDKKDENTQMDEQLDKKYNSKKLRRKAKALKAKIDKIRRADIVDRVNYGKSVHENINKEEEKEEILKKDEEIKKTDDKSCFLEIYNQQETEINYLIEQAEDMKTKIDNTNIHTDFIINMAFMNEENGIEKDEKSDMSIEEIQKINEQIEDIIKATTYDKNELNFPNNPENDRKAELGAKIINLQILLSDIIDKYETHWKMDRKLGYPDFLGSNGEHSPPVLQGTRNEQIKKVGSILPILEQRYLSKLRDNFHRILEIIMSMFNDKNCQYEMLLLRLEDILLNHNVRDEKIFNDLPDQNDPFVDFELDNRNCGAIGGHLKKKNCYDILDFENEEDFRHEIPHNGKMGNETPDEIYIKELSNLSIPEKCLTEDEIENIRQKTVENAYHLVQSFNKIVESDSSSSSNECKDDTYANRKSENEEIMLQAKAKFFTILTHDSKNLLEDKIMCHQNRPISEMFNGSTYEIKAYKEMSNAPSRWDSVVRNLHNLMRRQVIKKGDLIISAMETRQHFIISSGGNFGDVELALDRTGRPLAVKRIVRQNYNCCKALQMLITPLLDLQHRHILPYVMCDYGGGQELLLITPLCEYNLGEYLMCLKMNRNLSVSSDALIRQMLNGLKYLHGRAEPIVHGNLKPSNVLIDIHGTVRVAEFGVHKALYQNLRPPKSSIIWFSRETLERYQQQLVVECIPSSDIQVAGMLVHFVLTGGLHPFGIITEDILDNLIRGSTRLNVNGCEVEDLVSWMLVYEGSERPGICQVLAHVYFWDTNKKWQFLLVCTGVSEDGKILLREVEQFHNALNILALQNNITGDWVSIIREKFPYVLVTEILHHDSPIGVLKFLRTCIDLQNNENAPLFNMDLKTFFLGAFPALPISLYRLIENTDWLIHPSFLQFGLKSDI